jgi:hypothetical protein
MIIYIALVICMILSGCIKKDIKNNENLVQHIIEAPAYKKKSFDPLDIERQEAALLDIAIPPYQERLPLFCEDLYTGQVVLGYHSDCELEDHGKFFHEQMERYGWNLRREFKGPELFLEFEKPTRSCSVSIRPRTNYYGKPNGTDIVIYIEDSSIVY